MKKQGVICLIIAAMCWGSGYVAQSFGLRHVQPLAMVCGRYIVAAIALIPVAVSSVNPVGEGLEIWKKCAKTGFICGLPMAAAMILQQIGLADTGAGKGAFLSSLYIIFTPLLGLFLKKKVGPQIWLAVAVALLGSYFLCVTGGFTLGKGDIFILLCAVSFAVQNHVIEDIGDNGYPLVHSLFTELTVCLTAFILMLLGRQIPTAGQVAGAIIPMLCAGIIGGSIADTCAVIGQTQAGASLAAVLMSLESVFGMLFGVLILKETFTGREILGCVLIFIGVLIAQYRGKEA